MLFKSREIIIKFFYGYCPMVSVANYEATKVTQLKLLTPRQIFQILSVALSQVEAGNNSEILLNEIRQIFFILYQPKEITKKVYKTIVKSIEI